MQRSAPLAVVINSLMREAAGGAAVLEDIDKQTFVRLCEYAYIEDYTPAASTVDSTKLQCLREIM